MNKILSVLVVGAMLVTGFTYVGTNKKISEMDELIKEKEELITMIERENGVLMSKESGDMKDLKINSIKEMLNKESSVYPIKYQNDEYYFWVDSIIKQSLDLSQDYKYELTVKSQILKDRKDGKISYIRDEIPTKLNKLIEEENEKLKGVSEGNTTSTDNRDLRVPGLDYIDSEKVNNLRKELVKEVEVSNRESSDISFTVGSGESLLEIGQIVSIFVEDVIFKGKTFDKLTVDENEKTILVKVDNEVFEFDKVTNEFK